MPDGSTLSRGAVLMDIAHCLYWASKVSSMTGPIWMWADASEMAGKDWFLSIYDYMETREDLLEAFDEAHLLMKSTDKFIAAADGPANEDALDAAEQREASVRRLQQILKRHRQIPMAMGSGRTDLDVKCKLVAMKFYFEAHTIEATSRIMERVKALCTDMGTEQGLADVRGLQAKDFLPEWMQAQEQNLEEDAGLADSPPGIDQALRSDHFLPTAIVSAGICHVCDNMCKEVDAQLSWWETWLPGFKAVAFLLSKDHLRRRMVASCFTEQHSALAWLFDSGVQNPAQWRWGQIVDTLPKILKVKAALQVGWNDHAFKNISGNASDAFLSEEDSKVLDLGAVTRAVRSQMWWGYCQMLLAVHKMSSEFQAECEGCHCHTWMGNPRFEVQRESLLAARRALGHASVPRPGNIASPDGLHAACPLAGKAAVKFASGRLDAYLKEASDMKLVEVVSACAGLPDADTDTVVSDFRLAHAHICKYLSDKLGFWQRLPWKMAALGDWDPQRVVKVAEAILAEFDESPQDPDLHHKLTWAYLRQGSQVREQLRQLAQGTALSELPELKEKVAEFFFTPVSERCQERDHSIITRFAEVRRISGPYVSNRIRYPQLIQACFPNQNLCKQYLDILDQVRSDTRGVVQQLGLLRHPLVVKCMGAVGGKHKRTMENLKRILSCILYSADAESQYLLQTNLRKKREEVNGRLKRKADKYHEFLRPGAKKQKTSASTIREACLLKHLATTMAPGELYSFPMGAAAVTTQAEAHAPVHKLKDFAPPGSEAGACLEMDTDEHQGKAAAKAMAELGHRAQFFRLVLGSKKHKHVPIAPASGTEPPSTTMCIQLHSALPTDTDLLVSADLSSASAGADVFSMLPAASMDFDAMENKAMSWSRKRKSAYFFKGLERLVGNPVVEQMIRSAAFSEDCAFLVKRTDLPAMSVLNELHQLGLATFAESGPDTVAWVFTKLAAQTLSVAHHVHRPVPLFQRPPAGQALEDQTPYHWLCQLHDQGWAWQRAPLKVAERNQLTPYESGGAKIWYSSGYDLTRIKQYIWALLRGDDLLGQGTLQCIHHCCNASYYVKVLGGRFNGERPAALPAPSLGLPLEDCAGADDDVDAAARPQAIAADPQLALQLEPDAAQDDEAWRLRKHDVSALPRPSQPLPLAYECWPAPVEAVPVPVHCLPSLRTASVFWPGQRHCSFTLTVMQLR